MPYGDIGRKHEQGTGSGSCSWNISKKNLSDFGQRVNESIIVYCNCVHDRFIRYLKRIGAGERPGTRPSSQAMSRANETK
ncbi:MAG: hypothetical protein UY29_C0017G0022 [Parcubacteria group bacterium GW2011_GWC2_48_17]|nr:MAG: hypothetical protein UY29_C0017G0022 [Parcubacteria group bacterium GW2011_GWC2_48_17]